MPVVATPISAPETRRIPSAIARAVSGEDGCGVLNVVGPKLKRLRNGKNISQTEFSRLCSEKGVKRSVATISKIENQLRSVYDYEVQIFADVLGIPIDELYAMEQIVIEDDVQDAC